MTRATALSAAAQLATLQAKAAALENSKAELEALADRLEGEAERFEGALVALLDARDAFVRTGAEMSGVAAKGGDVDPTRFRVGNLVDDALGVRLFPIGDRGGATFLNNGQHWAQPVPKIVEPILSTAEIVRCTANAIPTPSPAIFSSRQQ